MKIKMKKKYRKPRPQPPRWFWWDNDNCWDCKYNHNKCNSCERLKIFRRKYRDKKYGYNRNRNA